MDDAVTYAVEPRVVADMRHEPLEDRGDRTDMAGTGNRPVGKLFAARIGDLQMGRGPDALDLAMDSGDKRPVGRRLEYREFDAGGPGIDNEYRFAHRGHPFHAALVIGSSHAAFASINW
jgi:hypothetical protein